MESSPDREKSLGTTKDRVAVSTLPQHGSDEVSSAEDAAAAASSVREPLGRMSGSERLEDRQAYPGMVLGRMFYHR